VSQTLVPTERFDIHSSRNWAFATGKFTAWLFPLYMSADRNGISTVVVRSFLTPWSRQEEHMPMSHVAEIGHDRGLIWDSISVESSGGLNPLVINGVAKGAAENFVTHVRALMGRMPPTAPA
jgi:hypothetical protein